MSIVSVNIKFGLEKSDADFRVNDLVIVFMPTVMAGISRKLLNQFRGPFQIISEHRLKDGQVAPNVFEAFKDW